MFYMRKILPGFYRNLVWLLGTVEYTFQYQTNLTVPGFI